VISLITDPDEVPLDNDMQVLQQFDLSWQFGPCIGRSHYSHYIELNEDNLSLDFYDLNNIILIINV
jgi:hypothetical protein